VAAHGGPMSDGEGTSDIILYQTEDGQTRLQVRLEGGTVWLSQALMAELYQTSKQNISLHLQNIYDDKELVEQAVVKECLTTGPDGKRYQVKHYNLEAILAVGYRVRSHRGVQFRRWATERLHGYLTKGFVMDDERLKEGRTLGADYFDELLERIRDIRASEKRFYKKITDIYALAVDYDPRAALSQEFFATVQNKLHWAIHGHTAAELIADRADPGKPNMGLTAWKGAKVRKNDVVIAKNYLTKDEVSALNRIVTMYLDYAEDQAGRQRVMHMAEWKDKLDGFLQFNGRDILQDAGTISSEIARRIAEERYEAFRVRRVALDDAHEPDEPL
jgi:hypothetical protein